MKCKYAVTFEFPERMPLTRRGELSASNAGTIARRAINEAKKEFKPINWSSLVVLLDRGDSQDEETDDE